MLFFENLLLRRTVSHIVTLTRKKLTFKRPHMSDPPPFVADVFYESAQDYNTELLKRKVNPEIE